VTDIRPALEAALAGGPERHQAKLGEGNASMYLGSPQAGDPAVPSEIAEFRRLRHAAYK
jgi:hypothetical protein